MNERIDHATEATALLENYAPDYTVAQVHATMALVEQQRIANVIALVALPAVHAESLDRYPGVKDQILEALGLS